MSQLTKEEIECLIVGVGLNVNQKEFIGEYIATPTSINNELSQEIDIDILKEKVYQKLIDNLNCILDNYDFYQFIKNHDYLKNKEACCEINNQKKYIKIIGINKDYSLKIIDGKKEKNIEAGEISFHV